MDLGPHAAFIWASYAAFALGIGAVIGWLVHDGARLSRTLAELEARGVRRRSSGKEGRGA